MVQTHIAAGAAAGAAAASSLGLPVAETLLAAVIGGAAATLPDLDHHASFASRRVTGAGAVAWLRHRGPTHSLAALAAFAALLRWGLAASGLPAPAWVWPVAVSGYASHLAADLLTVEGLQLLWPVLPIRVRLLGLACKTGSAMETLFWRPAFAAALGLVLLRGGL